MRRYLYDSWWFEVAFNWYEVQNVQSIKCNQVAKKKKLIVLTSSSVLEITKLQILDWNDSWTILKIRHISTFPMKISKSNSWVFIIKKLKYKSAFLLSKSKTKFWPVEGILDIY